MLASVMLQVEIVTVPSTGASKQYQRSWYIGALMQLWVIGLVVAWPKSKSWMPAVMSVGDAHSSLGAWAAATPASIRTDAGTARFFRNVALDVRRRFGVVISGSS